jgi:hypothetical protein
MRLRHLVLVAPILLVSLSADAAATPKVRRGPTSTRAVKPKPKPKAGIDAERATEIQNALIKAGYMSGTPSGAWDAPTQAAMEKLQADNGWQTKIVPDSRALIKLGLGPSTAQQPSGAVAAAPATDERLEPAAEPEVSVPAPSNQ